MSPEPTAKKWRILCIDDDPDVLSILKATLGTEHEVVVANDGLQAVSMLDFCDADFILCDVRMPNLDGFQTVEAIRRHPAYAQVPVFFLTAETERDKAKRGYAAGANLYLTKPFDPMRLLKNIDYFLQESGHEPRQRRLTAEAVAQTAQTARTAPQPQAPKPAAEPTPAAAPVPGGMPRVIVISAHATQLQRVESALQGKFECVVAAEPLASLQKIFRYEPDILVINPAIPRLSGWGLVQMISSNPRLRGLTIIILEDDHQPIDPRLLPAISKQPLLAACSSKAEILAALEAAASTPGFVVQPKTAPVAALIEEEEKIKALIEQEQAHKDKLADARQKQFSRIQNFIDSQLK